MPSRDDKDNTPLEAVTQEIIMPSLKTRLRRKLSGLGIKVPHRLLTKDQKFMRSVAETLTREDVVIDLGAHLGEASIEFSHFAGKVYAFEPHPEVFELLVKNTRNYDNIELLNLAASDEDGEADLFHDPHPKPGRFIEGSSLAKGKTNLTYANAHKVKTVNIASFVRDLGEPVRMIKMDVEGFEYRLITALLDGDVMDQIQMVHVEDHCDRIPTLVAERDVVISRIANDGLSDKFDFQWP